jgi:hypothetical protein
LSPSEIIRLIAFAKRLSAQSTHAPEAFLVSFVAWEALKIRILLVGMTASGMSVRESREVITRTQIQQQDGYNQLFKEHFGFYPHNTPDFGGLFRTADSFQKLRNGFTHGVKSSSPEAFREATIKIAQVFEADWTNLLGSILKRDNHTDPLGTLRRCNRPIK